MPALITYIYEKKVKRYSKEVKNIRDSAFSKFARITYILESCKTTKQAKDTVLWGRHVMEQTFNPPFLEWLAFRDQIILSNLEKHFKKMLDTIISKNEILKNA